MVVTESARTKHSWFRYGGRSKPAEQNQDQHDNEHEAEPAATMVSGPVEGASADPAKATE